VPLAQRGVRSTLATHESTSLHSVVPGRGKTIGRTEERSDEPSSEGSPPIVAAPTLPRRSDRQRQRTDDSPWGPRNGEGVGRLGGARERRAERRRAAHARDDGALGAPERGAVSCRQRSVARQAGPSPRAARNEPAPTQRACERQRRGGAEEMPGRPHEASGADRLSASSTARNERAAQQRRPKSTRAKRGPVQRGPAERSRSTGCDTGRRSRSPRRPAEGSRHQGGTTVSELASGVVCHPRGLPRTTEVRGREDRSTKQQVAGLPRHAEGTARARGAGGPGVLEGDVPEGGTVIECPVRLNVGR
jgi:hypothetical protein